MGHLRILILENSPLAQRLLEEALLEDPSVDRVTSFAGADDVDETVTQIELDAVVLTSERAAADGFELVTKLRRLHPAMPIIVLSRRDWSSLAATRSALDSGASDYMLRPTGVASRQHSKDYLRREVLARVTKAPEPCRRGDEARDR